MISLHSDFTRHSLAAPLGACVTAHVRLQHRIKIIKKKRTTSVNIFRAQTYSAADPSASLDGQLEKAKSSNVAQSIFPCLFYSARNKTN